MKLATWNVNSLTVRLPQVLDWLQANPVDVLALQELKLTDDKFPFDALAQAGLHLAPLLARNDAGDEVKGDQALGAGAVFILGAVDREGDAHAAEDHFRFFAPVAHQVRGLGLQPALVGAVVLADASR